jgi:predicted neutral ceramidase superfamily lipid hydrolase
VLLSYLIFALIIEQKSFNSSLFSFNKSRKSTASISTFISRSVYCFSILLIDSTSLTDSDVLSYTNRVIVSMFLHTLIINQILQAFDVDFSKLWKWRKSLKITSSKFTNQFVRHANEKKSDTSKLLNFVAFRITQHIHIRSTLNF